jgi:hypothetical protein
MVDDLAILYATKDPAPRLPHASDGVHRPDFPPTAAGGCVADHAPIPREDWPRVGYCGETRHDHGPIGELTEAGGRQ